MGFFYDYTFSQATIQENVGFVCLKLKRLSIRAAKHTTSGQIISLIDDLAEDELLSFGVEGLIAEDG